MVEETKPTPTAVKTYLTAAAGAGHLSRVPWSEVEWHPSPHAVGNQLGGISEQGCDWAAMCCSVLLARRVSLARSISRVRTLSLCLSAVLTLGLPSCICLSFSSLVHDTPRCILFTKFIIKNLYGTVCFLHGEEVSVPMWVDYLQKISVCVYARA